jgi:hypothetical protein
MKEHNVFQHGATFALDNQRLESFESVMWVYTGCIVTAVDMRTYEVTDVLAPLCVGY